MKAEDKVREIVFEMWGGAPEIDDMELTEEAYRGMADAIGCAQVAVDIVLGTELRNIPYKLYSGSRVACRDYWEEVKDILDKL